jgi:hypothetical protein
MSTAVNVLATKELAADSIDSVVHQVAAELGESLAHLINTVPLEERQALAARFGVTDEMNLQNISDASASSQSEQPAKKVLRLGGIYEPDYPLQVFQSEQPALEPPAPVGPAPIDVQSIAQIPAVDFQVDAPSAPKEIDCVVWTSRIKNPA